MKGAIVYDTSYGNTKTIAETIVKTLEESSVEIDLFYVKDAKELDGKHYDFLVLGSPTRMGTMSFAMKGFLGKMKSEEWMNKPFTVFDTELPDNIEHKEWSAAEKIAERLRDKKMNELLPVLKTVVLGNKGPLKEGEIERTSNYAKEFVVKLKEVSPQSAV